MRQTSQKKNKRPTEDTLPAIPKTPAKEQEVGSRNR